jgi:hypothetical protein
MGFAALNPSWTVPRGGSRMGFAALNPSYSVTQAKLAATFAEPAPP